MPCNATSASVKHVFAGNEPLTLAVLGSHFTSCDKQRSCSRDILQVDRTAKTHRALFTDSRLVILQVASPVMHS